MDSAHDRPPRAGPKPGRACAVIGAVPGSTRTTPGPTTSASITACEEMLRTRIRSPAAPEFQRDALTGQRQHADQQLHLHRIAAVDLGGRHRVGDLDRRARLQ